MKHPATSRATLLAMAVATLMAATAHAAAPAAAPAPAEPTQRVIVRFKDTLPSEPVNLADARVSDKREFGGLRPEVMGHIQRLEKAHGFKTRHGFSTTVKGFAAELTASQIAKLKADGLVQSIESDAKMKVVAQVTPYGIVNSGATTSTVARAGDGLDNATGLAGVQVFVVDTGIYAHPDLNVVERVNYVGDGIDSDCNGHGTHVAGTIGARDDANYVVGMAPGVALSALKVLDCTGSGYASSLIKAFDYAASVAKANPTVRYVANASVGFPTGTVLTTLDDSVRNAVASGVTVAVAAGNSADNTCGTTMVGLSSGTTATGVLATAAVDSTGTEASFSSYGSCVAIWAPGVSVASTSNTGSTATMSGTSMATPHVAGAAAVVLATNPTFTPAQVDAALKSSAKLLTTYSKDGRQIRHLNISSGTTAPAESVVRVDTPTVDFGIVRTKATAVRKLASFTNTGSASMTLTGLSGLPSAVRVVSNGCSKVAAGASCSMTLEMATSKRVTFSQSATTVGATKNASFVVKGTVQ